MTVKRHNNEIQSIPWDASGGGVVIINLAIWWLAMMGLRGDLRDVQCRPETLPLNVWWETQDASGATVFEYHLSR